MPTALEILFSLRNNFRKIITETTLQKLREGRNVTTDSIASLCGALSCQPGDIMEYVEDDSCK